jgi:hypothetical protein
MQTADSPAPKVIHGAATIRSLTVIGSVQAAGTVQDQCTRRPCPPSGVVMVTVWRWPFRLHRGVGARSRAGPVRGSSARGPCSASKCGGAGLGQATSTGTFTLIPPTVDITAEISGIHAQIPAHRQRDHPRREGTQRTRARRRHGGGSSAAVHQCGLTLTGSESAAAAYCARSREPGPVPGLMSLCGPVPGAGSRVAAAPVAAWPIAVPSGTRLNAPSSSCALCSRSTAYSP